MIFGCSIGLHKSLEKMCVYDGRALVLLYDIARWYSNVSLASRPSPLRINLDWVEEDTEA